MGIPFISPDRSPASSPGSADRRARVERVIERHGPAILRTARRYARTPEDAEDDYQRGVEILLTKAPDIPEPELVPWGKTVVKHEAFAIRRQGGRVALGAEQSFDGESDGAGDRHLTAVPGPDEQAERLERLRTGAEAMGQLKPQEVRCLVLLAEGYSYKQIQEVTGFSYTKVNRCLTEGRQTFLRRIEGIESGEECRRLEPALSALADGEADADDLAAVRRHLRGCLACRGTLRDFRAAPARVAALVPPGAIASGAFGTHGFGDVLAGAGDWLQRRVASVVTKLRSAGEAAAAPKAGGLATAAAPKAGAVVAAAVVARPGPDLDPPATILSIES